MTNVYIFLFGLFNKNTSKLKQKQLKGFSHHSFHLIQKTTQLEFHFQLSFFMIYHSIFLMFQLSFES
jgi:hypothetical protein